MDERVLFAGLVTRLNCYIAAATVAMHRLLRAQRRTLADTPADIGLAYDHFQFEARGERSMLAARHVVSARIPVASEPAAHRRLEMRWEMTPSGLRRHWELVSPGAQAEAVQVADNVFEAAEEYVDLPNTIV